MSELLKYATATTIILPLRKASDSRLAGSGDWTPVLGTGGGTNGDVQVSINGAAFVNVAGVATYTNGKWQQPLSIGETTGATILVRVVDQDGPAIQDELLSHQTFGNAAAFYPDTYSSQLLPSALVGGRVDASVGAMAAGVVTAAAVATDAIDADALAASAVSEIAAGMPVSGGGGSSQSGLWDYSTTTTAADPTSGRVRFNGPLSTATEVYLDDLTSGGTDASPVLQALLSGDSLYVQDQGNSAIVSRYLLTAAPVDQGGWWRLAVSPVSSAGVPSNNDSLLINFRQPGVSAGEVADAVFAYLVETGLTFRHFCQDMEAMLAGRVNGAGTGTESFRDYQNTKNRVTIATTAEGDRLNVTHSYD